MRAPPAPCFVLAAALFVLSLSACGGNGSKQASTSILDSSPRNVTFPEVRQAVARLYRDHPDIESFVSREVQYTPTTRDKVLRVCRKGGRAVKASELETSRIFACAPLIFFFYNYGVRKSVGESVEVARRLYLYAVMHNRRPYESRPVLTRLLRSWGIE